MLTDAKIKGAIAPPLKPYKIYDEKGLYIIVQVSGAKWWRFKYMWEGREKTLALGTYPDVSLAFARGSRDEMRKKVAEGIDPSQERKEAKEARVVAEEQTFGFIATQWLAIKEKELEADSYANTDRQMRKYVLPYFGNRAIASIDSPDVLAFVQQLESKELYNIAKRCTQHVGAVLRLGSVSGKKSRDVTPDLKGSTIAPKRGHRPAITQSKRGDAMPQLLQRVWGYDGSDVVTSVLKILALTLLRPGEAAAAEWNEIDIKNRLWEIPVRRMKRVDPEQQSHIVPLSSQVIEIFEQLRPVSGHLTHVFPNRRRCVVPMDKVSLATAMRRMGYRDVHTPHGFRATGRTMLAEELGFNTDWIEMQLAHTVRDPNGRAYNRTMWVDHRANMLQVWADYLDKLRTAKTAGASR